jgi:hypothetical protein
MWLWNSSVGVEARIEILLPSTGSRAMAGANGSLARTCSSCSLSGVMFCCAVMSTSL